MHRFGFTLKVRPELVDDYRRHHAAVWPDMLDALRRAGWHNYSLFLPGRDAVRLRRDAGHPGRGAGGHGDRAGQRALAGADGPYFEGEGLPADQMMRELDLVFHLD